jgi:dihydroneopterin aldolase
MSDVIALTNMRFQGRHGVSAGEREMAQPFEVDVELHLDLRPAGLTDDLDKTVDYRGIFEICRSVVEGPSRQLIETLAEAIAEKVLEGSEDSGVEEVPLPGELDHASVEITRRAPRGRD